MSVVLRIEVKIVFKRHKILRFKQEKIFFHGFRVEKEKNHHVVCKTLSSLSGLSSNIMFAKSLLGL